MCCCVAIVALYRSQAKCSVGDIDGCEIFSGMGAVTAALRARNFVVASADIEMGQCFDITSSAGFLPLRWQ